MRSTDLLPLLREMPAGEAGERMSFGDMTAGLTGTDRGMSGAELTSAVSFSLWGVFDSFNTDDTLSAAYEAQYPNLASDHSLHESWAEMVEHGPESTQGFLNGVKGKVAEFHTKDLLEDRGYTAVKIASDPTQEVWDISGVDPGGHQVLIQVKSGTSLSAGDLLDHLEEHPDVLFAVGGEIYDKAVAAGMDTGQMIDIGPDYARVEGIKDGLETLSANEGIDIPDSVAGIVPYAGAVIAGARLAYNALRTDREFKEADCTTRNRIQVVRALTLMSRMGVTTVLSSVGGMAGTSAGGLVPGAGNVVAGIGGAIIGASVGIYLEKHLRPHMLNLALNITGLTHDDLFYYKNKQRIDDVAFAFQTRARELAAIP